MVYLGCIITSFFNNCVLFNICCFFFSHLFEKELAFVDNLISQDMRNNSAWNQRYFVINNSNPNTETILEELKYTFGKIELLSKNESAWNYLRG